MLNILLLEDQPAVRDVIFEVIKEIGVPANVGCAASLKQARELFKDNNWDGMVADLSLGDGQSLDLIAELREQGNAIPIILVSGFLSSERMRTAKQLGVNHVLHKPFHPNALLEKLNKLFNTADFRPEPNPSSAIQHSKLLPELFEMDRHLGLFFRLLNDIPQHKDVVQICGSALSLAMDMVHTNRGFMALFERTHEDFVMVAHHEAGESDSMHTVSPSCGIATTPFGPLLDESEEFIHLLPEHDHGPVCWPSVSAKDYIAIPLRLQGTPMGVLCLMDCQSQGELSDRLKYMLGLLMAQLDTLLDNCAVHAALDKSMKETLIALVRSLEARDKYTKDHSARVSKMAVQFAKRLDLDDETIALVRIGALLHDIGKTGVPDSVLLKPGAFSDKEYAIIKTHPGIGDSILKHMDTLAPERQIVRHHHERIDGYGYPDKLKGDQIPFVAKIVCVADSIDAMTTHRVYRQAKPLSFCVEQLRQNSGTQFDTRVVEVAIAAIEEGLVDTQAAPEHDDSGNVLPAFATS